MNGVHDLGGMHGFGPVIREPIEPVFHADWERRVFALRLGLWGSGRANGDEMRHAIERMEPARYLSTSYYEHWLYALETLLVEKGIISRAELESAAAGPLAEPAQAACQNSRRSGERSRQQRGARRARFKPGDRVLARNLNPAGHTRLPRYARAKPGVVLRDLGVFTFPDTHAHGAGRKPQHAYTVRFEARDLWGKEAGKRERVHVDLWEDYLEPVEAHKRARSKKR